MNIFTFDKCWRTGVCVTVFLKNGTSFYGHSQECKIDKTLAAVDSMDGASTTVFEIFEIAAITFLPHHPQAAARD